MTTQTGDRSVHVGGNIVGSQVITGDHTTATMQGVTVAGPDPTTVDIAAELAALRTLLAGLGAPDQGKIDRAMADAEEEAAKPQPDKAEIGQALERAVGYAKRADALSSHLETIAPRVAAVVSWLGERWKGIAALIGVGV